MHPPRTRLSCYRWIITLFGIFCLPLAARAEKIKDLNPQGYVNDFAGVLDAQTAAQITALCTEVDEKTHAQISVVTIKTLEGLEAADFANNLFKQWGVGHKDDNRGILVLLATDDHKYWTEVGYGLEPILPDGKVGGFGREMAPRLRAGDYNGGLLDLTAEIAEVIATDRGVKLDSLSNVATPVPVQDEESPSGQNSFPFLPVGIIVLLIVLTIIRNRGGRGIGMVGPGIFWGGGGFGGGGFSGGGGGGFGGFGGGMSGGGGAGGSW
ncbi:MAG TPA: TPM domain-containing protein [Terriglobia bacterium]|nr:TPM domain-containing protein [Terriglobia bacterium]